MDQKAREELRLRVSVRQVYSGDGTLSAEMRVFCPDQARLVSIEECTKCPHWSGLHLDPHDRNSLLTCAPRRWTGASACCRVSAENQDLISAAMTASVVCVRPDLSIEAAADIFHHRHISAAPVVDEEGKLLGLVSRADVLGSKSRTVGEVMTPLVFALHESASVSQAAALMVAEGVHQLMVVSPRGELVGIVSALDVMRWLAERDGYLRSSF